MVQMERALLRVEGVRYLLEVVDQTSLLPSVQYAVLCGWLGLSNTSNRYTHKHSIKTHMNIIH